MTDARPAETTVDAFLGGRVDAVQPTNGHHRSGLEAVLLAASISADASGVLLDLGAGAGVAGLCAASRAPGVTATLVEREPDLLACAGAALARQQNQSFAQRVRLALLDIAAPEAARVAAGVGREAAEIALTNPPFYVAGEVRPSPDRARAAAHVMESGLDPWFRFATWSLAPGGGLVAILAATALAEVLRSLDGRFGDVTVLPLHPRPDRRALRILITARKGSRAPLSLLPGLVLHDGSGHRFAPGVEALLRGEADLAAIHPAWRAVA